MSWSKNPLPWIACVLFTSVAAHAATNFVNMSGSSCRGRNGSAEINMNHLAGETRVVAGSGTQRLYCPINRRGTSPYGGKNNSVTPTLPAGTEKKVKIDGVTVRATDGSTTGAVTCMVFGTRLSDGFVFYGPSKILCSTSTLGCGVVSNAWTGTNTMVLRADTGFDQTVETVSFGVICDLRQSSKIQYIQASITPN